jgi:hypothetical protein
VSARTMCKELLPRSMAAMRMSALIVRSEPPVLASGRFFEENRSI